MTGQGPPAGRVLCVVGTRPEAIKMAPVIRGLRELGPGIEVGLALTGQHDELVAEVLDVFGLRPEFDLAIMKQGQSPGEVGALCLTRLGSVFEAWHPGLVLVEGDTATVFFGALAAYHHRIPVGHVEAGLRTGNLLSPFPEEGYRRMAAVIADLHFAPTADARKNLLREGIDDGTIHVTGNPVVDALLQVAEEMEAPKSPSTRHLCREGAPPFALLTAHRRESFGRPLERVFAALLELLDAHPTLEIVYPLHPNPAVEAPARRILAGHPRIHLLAPLGYTELVWMLAHATLVLTDSGGIQEEAPTFGTPVLVLREVTERPEGVDAGLAELVGTEAGRIVRAALGLLGRPREAREKALARNPYGDGSAGRRIAEIAGVFLTSGRAGRGR